MKTLHSMKTLHPNKPVKKDSPALAQAEEKTHQDLDGDGEKGESPAHVRKVLSQPRATKGLDAAKLGSAKPRRIAGQAIAVPPAKGAKS